jgi:hypothetical protein
MPVDAVNAQFYGRFPYPPPSAFTRRLDDPSFEADILSQSVGDWQGDVLPDRSRVWVAGRGRDQAVLTALRFPMRRS